MGGPSTTCVFALALLRQFLAARSIVEVTIRPLNRLTVTEWTVTEWTESRYWTESTETYEAKRSAQANNHFSESQQGECLAAVLLRFHLAAASPLPQVGTRQNGRSWSGMAKNWRS